MFPQKLHQQNENADQESHQKQRYKAFKYVGINFFKMKHAVFFWSNKITAKSSIITYLRCEFTLTNFYLKMYSLCMHKSLLLNTYNLCTHKTSVT